jgi:hypothetical protein
MKISEIIAELEKLKDNHGDVTVQISGCYGSETAYFYFDDVTFSDEKLYDESPSGYINIPTDLCSG